MKKCRLVLALLLTILIFISAIGCHKEEVPTVSPSPIACPIPTTTPSAIGTPLPTLPTIQLYITSESGLEGKEPYDIFGAIRAKLESAGFEIAPRGDTEYDAQLWVRYEEFPALPYVPSDDHPISIDCLINLYDNAKGQIFSQLIRAGTPSYSKKGTYYDDAIYFFQESTYFKYLGEILATRYGIDDEVLVLLKALNEIPPCEKNWGKTSEQEVACKVLYQTINALGELRDQRTTECLLCALDHENPDIREDTALALGMIKDVRALLPLIDLLKDDYSGVRNAAAKSLGMIGDARAVESLAVTLQHDDVYHVRMAAAESLGWIGDSAAIDTLIFALLNDSISYVRSRAAEALGTIGDVGAVPALTQALVDKDEHVRSAAQAALDKIGAGGS